MIEEQPAVASPWRRFCAFWVDSLLVEATLLVGLLVSRSRHITPEASAIPLAILLGQLTLRAKTGQTAGSRALGLRMVRADGGGQLGWVRPAVHGLIVVIAEAIGKSHWWTIHLGASMSLQLSGLPTILLFAPAVFNARGQALHDRFVGVMYVTAWRPAWTEPVAAQPAERLPD